MGSQGSGGGNGNAGGVVGVVDSTPAGLAARYASVCERVNAAAAKSGRSGSDIILVAVTKHADPDQIRGLVRLGHRDFGENRVQQLVQHAAIVEEYMSRLRVLPTTANQRGRGGADILNQKPGAGQAGTQAGRPADVVRWHMIGHLQRNKARKVAEFVRLVHSVDSLRLAEELQIIANKRDEIIDVLVQVNCSGEKSKFGCPVPAAMPLAEQIDTMINVRVRGLMTMAPLISDPVEAQDEARGAFARCRELYEEIRRSGVSRGAFNILSMGMSGDFEIAIAEGANVVRVGTAIFGEAPPSATNDEPDGEGGHDDEADNHSGM